MSARSNRYSLLRFRTRRSHRRGPSSVEAEKVGKANEFAPAGGPDAEQLRAALGMVRERFEVTAAGMASYDPAFDADGRVLRAAIASASSLTNPTSPPG